MPDNWWAAGTLPALPCACAGLRRAARAVTRLYDEALRSSGLRATQFTLLQALAMARQPLTQGALGDLLALDSTTLSRTLRPLERRGWIRTVPARDRRLRHVTLSASGRRQFERATPHWQRAQNRLRERVGALQWKRLLGVVDPVARAAQRETTERA